MKALAATLISWGPLGLFFFALIDSAGIPLPAGVDALLLVLAALNPAEAYLAAAAATAGSLIGKMGLFYAARKGGRKFLDKRTVSGRGAKLRQWFLRYGLITVFIPSLLPIPLPVKVFVLCAGALGVRPRTFFFVFTTARVLRFLGLAYLGAHLGEHSGQWLKAHSREIILFSLFLFVVLFLLVKLSERRHRTAQ